MAKRQAIDAEALFQTKSVAEIRQIEGKTRHEIEDKKTQLRQVVGDSYRDLISSADTIVGIAEHSKKVAFTLEELQSKLKALSAPGATPAAAPAAHGSSYDKLFAVGSRIKYLIDSPETIYGCLDSREFLAAAQRYVRTVEVHRSFAAHSKHAAKRFPLLRHHWPLVKKLGGETWDRAAGWLREQGGASPEQVAGVLAAMALLRPVDGAEVLKHHLAARQAYVTGCLAAAAADADAAGGADADALAVVLADVASLVCTTVAQCGELFLSRPGVTSRPLLADVAGREGLGASELLFDPGTGAHAQSEEATAWRRHQTEACARLGGLAAAGVALECSRWLEGLAAEAGPLVERLLAAGCDSGAALHSVEVGVQEALAAWRYRLGGSVKGGGSADAESEELTWSDACQWVVGHPVALWPLLMEAPLVARAKGLIAEQFAAVSAAAGVQVQAALSEALALAPYPPGAAPAGRWAESLEPAPGEASAAVRWQGSVALGTAAAAAAVEPGSHPDPKWWLPKAEALLKALDANLEGALGAALAVTEAGSSGAGAGAGAGPGHSAAAAPMPRTVVLQPFVQESCSAAVEEVAAALEAAQASLPAADGGATEVFGPAAYAALFVGRVAQGLAQRSAPLRLLLGPPSAWAAARTAGSKRPAAYISRHAAAAASAAAAAMEVSPKLDAAQRRLQGIAGAAYALWAAWASRGLAEQLVMAAAGDVTLAADAPLRGWEEAAMEGSADAGGDVKFWLPAAPSPAAMAAALGACREVERAGGAAADNGPVQLLRWHLAGDVCSALRSAFSTGGPFAARGAVSEKGLLQLLFDLRFLTSALEATPPPGTPPTAAAGRVREVAAAEAELASRIDPIDWATYEAHLYGKTAAFTARSKTLLGLAMRGAPPPKTAPGGTAPAAPPSVAQPAESNVLRMAPAGARFAYLPVNTPSALRQAARPAAAMPAAAAALLDDGEESQYSFASLSTGRSRPTSAAGASAAASPAGSAGVGAAALEALRGSALGSLFGDKAADLTASLGDYTSSLSSGGTGLLSSFTSFSKR